MLKRERIANVKLIFEKRKESAKLLKLDITTVLRRLYTAVKLCFLAVTVAPRSTNGAIVTLRLLILKLLCIETLYKKWLIIRL